MNFISIFTLKNLFPFCFRARIEIEIFIQRSAIKVLSLINNHELYLEYFFWVHYLQSFYWPSPLEPIVSASHPKFSSTNLNLIIDLYFEMYY